MVQKAQPYKYQVYDEIKRGIFKGQYRPGDVLTERKLSDEMGISRTPIREAMQMLTYDGWLVMETYKGAVVREFDFEYVREVLKIRKTLEMLAVEEAVLNVTDRELEELEKIAGCQRDMLNHYDEYDFIEADRRFHKKIYEMSRNGTLESLLNNFNDIISFSGIHALKQEQRKRSVMEEHQRILEALKSRDGDMALRAMEDHMSKTLLNIESEMKKH